MRNTFEFVGKIYLPSDNYKVYNKPNGTTKRYSFAVKANENNSEFVDILTWNGTSPIFYASLYNEEERKVEWTKIKLSNKDDITIINKAMASSKYQTNILGENKKFIYAPDFVEYIKNNLYKALAENPNQMFKVQGDFELNAYQGSYTPSYKVRNIWATDETEGYLKADLDLYYGQGAVDESRAITNGVYTVNGYLRQYSSQHKENLFYPISLTYENPPADNKLEQKRKEIILKNLTSNVRKDDVYHLNWRVDVFNGAEIIEKVELTDEQRQEIELGFATEEDYTKKTTGPNRKDLIIEKYILDGEFKNGRIKLDDEINELLKKMHNFEDAPISINTDTSDSLEDAMKDLDFDEEEDDLPF